MSPTQDEHPKVAFTNNGGRPLIRGKERNPKFARADKVYIKAQGEDKNYTVESVKNFKYILIDDEDNRINGGVPYEEEELERVTLF
ncbi:hypothetical protein GGR53DRAFT_98165 [Hypoxylon sp. FL1150]|nr:hypothetical protein GGR53DRAFT_98165 [Hypoxylon sp. FL1150]